MNIASFIDHTVLKPAAVSSDIIRLCSEALVQNFAAVCVPPNHVKTAKSLTAGHLVKTATVIGFPFGYNSVQAKKAEIQKAIDDGADELDIVINLSALKEGNYDYLSKEIVTLLQPARLHRKIIKVIIESGILTEQEIIQACALYARHKVDFVKTSTGYAEKGATVEDVKLMRSNLPSEIKLKASGGIRTFAFAKELIDAGADRIGTSSGIAIVRGE